MAIASSGAISIGNAAGSGRSLNIEVGRTHNTANTSMTTLVTAAVTGSTPRGSGTVTQAQPHSFSEWHSYTHTLGMGTIDYDIRMARNISGERNDWGLYQTSTDFAVEDSAHACGGILLFRTHDASNTYVKAKFFGDGLNSISQAIYDTSATAGTTSSAGTTVITIPVGSDDVAGGVTISATVNYISGDTVTYPAGYTNHFATADDMSGTGATLLVCKGADLADADPGSEEEIEGNFHIELTASASGYATTLLDKGVSGNGIIVKSQNDAYAESGE